MNVLHVTHSYWPATLFGGPIYSTLGLCEALARRPDVVLRVVSTDAANPKTSERLTVEAVPMRYEPGYDVYFIRQLTRNIAPRQLLEIWRQMRWSDCVLLTGTYSFHVIPTLIFARLMRKPLAWSPRGALLDSHNWAGHRRPTAKRMFERLCRLAIGAHTQFVVTSQDEASASRARVGNIPATIVTNGVEMPTERPCRVWRPDGRLRLMWMGRLDPKKGLENLILAMPLLGAHVSLDVYGQGETAYDDSLKKLVAETGVGHRVRFHGHVDSKARHATYATADLFVLPSHSENFAMVVAEALSYGVPAIVSHGAPWAEIVSKGAGVWVDNAPASLAAAIVDLSGKNLEEMGMRGRGWMESDFSWDARAAELMAVFDQIQLPGNKPTNLTN